MSDYKIEEIRERHEEALTRLARATKHYMPISEYEALGWQGQRDRAFLLDLTDRQRAEIERLRDALEYMANVCPAIDPDGDQAHERARNALEGKP